MCPAETPLVTIGVPVYNEAGFLADALDSLLGQDYPNVEIIISDNGSNDATAAVCRSFVARDSRVKYHRLDTNRGAAFNSNRIIELANGPLFMRASGHDLWSTNYVSACVAELAVRPDAVIAFGSTEWIDGTAADYPKETGWSDTRGMSVLERFFTQLWGNMHPIMGVARTEAVRRALPFSDMAAADLAFLLEMSLMGDFIHAPSATWYRRELRGPQSYKERMRRYRSAEFNLIGSRLESVAPYGKLLMRVPQLILRSQLSALDKFLLLLLVYPNSIARYAAARTRHEAAYRRETASGE